MKSVLISGCNGFISSNLIPKFLEKGYHIEGIAKKKSKSNYKIHQVNLTNNNSLSKIKSKFDYIVHLAGESEENDFQSMFLNNVLGTQNLLEFALRKKIKKFIFISGHNVYSPFLKLPILENASKIPISNYGFTKLMSENLVEYYSKNFNLKSTILRISSTYGNNQKKEKMISKFINNYKNSKKIIIHKYLNGYQKMDLIHVDDVCDAIIKSINYNKSSTIFNISSGNSYTINDILSILQENLNSNSKIMIKKINQKTSHFKYDINLAKKELMFKPKISLEDGIKELI